MIVLCALVRFHAFVYFWVNYMIVITEFCFTCMAKKKPVGVAIRKTNSKTTTVTRSYTKDQVNRNR